MCGPIHPLARPPAGAHSHIALLPFRHHHHWGASIPSQSPPCPHAAPSSSTSTILDYIRSLFPSASSRDEHRAADPRARPARPSSQSQTESTSAFTTRGGPLSASENLVAYLASQAATAATAPPPAAAAAAQDTPPAAAASPRPPPKGTSARHRRPLLTTAKGTRKSRSRSRSRSTMRIDQEESASEPDAQADEDENVSA